jgi:hypothetical protein
MNTSDTLNKAADELQANGWMSPHVSVGPNPTCAQVAIGRVGRTVAEKDAADRALWTHIGGTCVGDIWRWNDADGRTAEQVIETLRAAAVIEAAKETADERALVSHG